MISGLQLRWMPEAIDLPADFVQVVVVIKLSKSTITSQVAAHLREKILQGHWRHFLPGRDLLAAELGVSHMTVSRAVEQLEAEGLIVNQGNGRRRRIVLPKSGRKSRCLRIAVLRFEAEDAKIYYVVDFVHQLREAGHQVNYADKTLSGLKMDVKRVARLVKRTKADAWIVISGSYEILQWFAAQSLPCFGLFGKLSKLAIAGGGANKSAAYAAVSNRLTELNHKRIVLLARWIGDCFSRQYLFGAFEARGIPASDYSMPRFTDTPESFHRCLEALFATTPPTALIILNPELLYAVQQFLARRKLLVPEDVSLVCTDPDPKFFWCQPTIAHITWDSTPWVRRITQWADNIARGKRDTRKAVTQAEFVDGGTVGPAPP